MAKLHGLANQKLCYIRMLLNIEKSGEQDKEHSEKWLVNTDPGALEIVAMSHSVARLRVQFIVPCINHMIT